VEYLVLGLVFLVGITVGYLLRRAIGEARISSAEAEAKRILDEAKKTAETKRREILVEARDNAQKLRDELEREVRERRQEIHRLERRLMSKEEALERRQELLIQKEENLTKKERILSERERKLESLHEQAMKELERISGLSRDDAKEKILSEVRQTAKEESARIIREAETQAREEAERRAKGIISLAIQRCAADHVAENTVSVVELPSDDMKGRIIGREGRKRLNVL